MPHFKYTLESLETCFSRHKKGESISYISRDVGADRKTLSLKLRKAGFPVRNQAQSQKVRREQEKS